MCSVSNAFLLLYLRFPHFWSAFYHSANFDIFIYRCGKMQKDSGHVVCCFDQSASFRIFYSAFYFPHSAFRNSAFYPHPELLTNYQKYLIVLVWRSGCL